jgi:peptidoglycan/LPS O-acetylase OafA/YrhL
MTVKSSQIPYLDGLRGIAAVWVFLSHVQILSGIRALPVLSYGESAVDLFMLLSGFLMAHHYLERRASEPWELFATWRSFWIRRFFRISPAYYIVLAVALLAGPYIGEARTAVASLWPVTATADSRYLDRSVGNIVAHLTYTFGAIPKYAFDTPLPDWSIGLEMQFYAAFPFLMLLIARCGKYRTAIALATGCTFASAIAPAAFAGFAMPSFLPLKLYVFLAGILLALTRGAPDALCGLIVATILVIVCPFGHVNSIALMRGLLVVGLFALLSIESIAPLSFMTPLIFRMRSLLGGRVAAFMGDTAYGFYLVHLLVVIPLAGLLTRVGAYTSASGPVRFFVVATIAAAVAYPAAWVLHRLVEQPGIRWGKRVVRRKAAAKSGAPVVADS